MLYYECHPATCPVGDNCLNQRFQRRRYPKQEPFRTGDERGWGLKAKADIKQVGMIRRLVLLVCNIPGHTHPVPSFFSKLINLQFVQYNNVIQNDAPVNISYSLWCSSKTDTCDFIGRICQRVCRRAHNRGGMQASHWKVPRGELDYVLYVNIR